MRTIILGLSVALVACDGSPSQPGAPATPTPASASASSEAAIGSLPTEGDAYLSARARLLSTGWQPVRGECVGAGTSPAVCQDFPEVQDCSGTGVGFCSMQFARPGECLTLVTTGGPPARSGSETAVERATLTSQSCAKIAAKETSTVNEVNGFAGLSAAAGGLCARLEREGVSKTTLIDDFVPYYPDLLKSAERIEAAALTPAQLNDAVRYLTCGAGLSGFGPDIPEAALPLFSSARYGAAAMVAVRKLAAEGSVNQRTAARGFQDQMRSYLVGAAEGNG